MIFHSYVEFPESTVCVFNNALTMKIDEHGVFFDLTMKTVGQDGMHQNQTVKEKRIMML